MGETKLKKIPYGISNYKNIVEENYLYVDKTRHIEVLESLGEPFIFFLRPRRFGKSLFTSVLEYYYDVNAKGEFEKLFGNTYIGKHPTAEISISLEKHPKMLNSMLPKNTFQNQENEAKSS